MVDSAQPAATGGDRRVAGADAGAEHQAGHEDRRRRLLLPVHFFGVDRYRRMVAVVFSFFLSPARSADCRQCYFGCASHLRFCGYL